MENKKEKREETLYIITIYTNGIHQKSTIKRTEAGSLKVEAVRSNLLGTTANVLEGTVDGKTGKMTTTIPGPDEQRNLLDI